MITWIKEHQTYIKKLSTIFIGHNHLILINQPQQLIIKSYMQIIRQCYMVETRLPVQTLETPTKIT